MGTLSDKAAAILSAVAAGAIAWLTGHTPEVLSILALLFPPLAFAQRTRIGAAGVALIYYGASSVPVLQISCRYFGRRSVWVGILSWAIAGGILAIPWIGLWSGDRNQTWWRLPAALVLATVPPIGIIGWASPVMPAGILFPGLGWLGIGLAIWSMVAIRTHAWNTIMAIGLVSLASIHLYQCDRTRTSDWTAVNTTFGNTQRSDDPLAEFSIAEQIQRTAIGTSGRVIIFPEMVVRNWGEGADLFWRPIFDRLRSRGSTILIGAKLPVRDSTTEYRNAVVIRGADNPPEFHQRIPVPIAMWKPWGAKSQVPLSLFGPTTVQLAGERAALLICYEQLLPWSYLTAMWRRPGVIVGLSNAYWTGATIIPKNQSAALQSWGRLFNIPIISATNY
jgi:hypothetical protein